MRIQEFADRICAPRRMVQTWADGGLIRCHAGTRHAGKGTPRDIPESEYRVGLVLVELAELGLPYRVLESAAQCLRENTWNRGDVMCLFPGDAEPRRIPNGTNKPNVDTMVTVQVVEIWWYREA